MARLLMARSISRAATRAEAAGASRLLAQARRVFESPRMTDMRNGTCPLCHHNEIVQGATTFAYTAPIAVARDVSAHHLMGPLNIWVCRRCGCVQWFAFEPEKIAIGDKYSTRLIKGPESNGPYR